MNEGYAIRYVPATSNFPSTKTRIMEKLGSGGSQCDRVYSIVQENLIRGEFSRLKDQCYLEHAGATLYADKQISNVLGELTGSTFGNPHARNTSSKLAEDAIDQIRYQILQHFNTSPEDYSVIFTSGTTAALKLVAETFRYENDAGAHGALVYLEDNHTSVLGMREYAKTSTALPHDNAFKIFADDGRRKSTSKKGGGECSANSLFVYPAQCNFSGAKYALTWIEKVVGGYLDSLDEAKEPTNWFCLLDAASFVSTNHLDLSQYRPDFVCLSFYKIFGYPTGLGALLVKNSSAHVLKKTYFGGGTVLMALSSERTHIPRTVLHEHFEDGTLPFLSIIALRHGFETLKRFSLSMADISRHTFSLARYVYRYLLTLHHGNGKPAVVLYHDTDFENVSCQGGIVNFNLLRPTGEYIGYAEVLHISNLYGIHLRTGCFCNPGACQRHLRLTPEDVKHHFNSGHVCGDQHDLVDGYPTGSVRISFGYMSTKKEADTFLNMVEECFVTKPILRMLPEAWRSIRENAARKFQDEIANGHKENGIDSSAKYVADISNGFSKVADFVSNAKDKREGVLEQIFIYPVKSCSSFSVKSGWELTTTGFKYDREWMIVNSGGICVTQKQDIRLCLIKPYVNLQQKLLELYCEGFPQISVPLEAATSEISRWSSKCQSKVCGDRIQGWDCGNEVGNWLSEVLGLPGLRLLKQCNNIDEAGRSSKLEGRAQLSLTNQAQFLLINTASVQWLLDCIPENQFDGDLQGLIRRFRPNFVVNFHQPFAENACSEIQIGKLSFTCDGQCTRCQMICINQDTAEKSVEPLKTLSREFGGKISFGMYLSSVGTNKYGKVTLNEHVTGCKS